MSPVPFSTRAEGDSFCRTGIHSQRNSLRDDKQIGRDEWVGERRQYIVHDCTLHGLFQISPTGSTDRGSHVSCACLIGSIVPHFYAVSFTRPRVALMNDSNPQAAEWLEEAGYETLVNVEGGFSAWARDDSLPVEV